MTYQRSEIPFMPRVAMVVTRFPSISQTFIALQIAELVKFGFSVDIYNIGEIGNDSWVPEGTEGVFAKLNIHHLKHLAESSIRFQEVENKVATTDRYFSFKTRIFRRLGLLSNEKFRELTQLAYFFNPIKSADIIHCQCIDLGKKIIRLRRYGFNLKRQAHFCAVRGSDISKTKNLNKINWEEFKNYFDLMLPVCRHFKELLIKNGCKNHIEIIHSPVNTERLTKIIIKKEQNEDNIKFISVGRLVEKKGLSYALTICAELKKRGIDFHYTIIGDGPLGSTLKEKVVSLGIEQNVDFLGSLPTQETLSRIAEADILLAPSCKANNGDAEGIPNVLKEAMLLGLQVVSTYHSGIPELVKNGINGYLCEERDTSSLLTSTLVAIENRANWKTISDAAKKEILIKYSPAATSKPLIESYFQRKATSNYFRY